MELLPMEQQGPTQARESEEDSMLTHCAKDTAEAGVPMEGRETSLQRTNPTVRGIIRIFVGNYQQKPDVLVPASTYTQASV